MLQCNRHNNCFKASRTSSIRSISSRIEFTAVNVVCTNSAKTCNKWSLPRTKSKKLHGLGTVSNLSYSWEELSQTVQQLTLR